MDAAIRVDNVSKSYGKVRAVDQVSFNLNPGEILGLIGPDGAGKTTIIRMIVSLLKPDQGVIHFLGRSVHAHPYFVRSQIGYMPQRFSLYQDLTVEENLTFFGNLFQVPAQELEQRKKELYEFSRLEPFKDRRASQLSGGMKQKLALSCMLIHQPQVVVMDEPTYGVDPISRGEFWDILQYLAQQGTSILVTTAYMDEAHLCHRVGLMHQGRLLALDTPKNLLQRFQVPIYRLKTRTPNSTYQRLKELSFPAAFHIFGDGIHVADVKGLGLAELQRIISTKLGKTYQMQAITATLEDLLLQLMEQKDGEQNS